MTKQLILLLALILSFSHTFAQIRQAEKEMELYHFTEAVSLLQKALEKKNPDEVAKITALLARCYRKMNQWDEAGRWYKEAIGNGNQDPETLWFYAQALRNTGRYAKARTLFLAYDSLHGEAYDGTLFASFCDSATHWLTLPPGYSVSPVLTLNSPQSEFGVVPFGDGLLFASDRLQEEPGERNYGWTGHGYLRLYASKLELADSVPVLQSPATYSIGGDQRWHNGPVSVTRQGDLAVINRTLLYRDKGKKEPGSMRTHLLKLFTTTREGDKWSKPDPFFLNNDNWSVGHPALSPGGDTLVFVSDMPGGFGGTDLYVCIWQGNRWSDPVNLGSTINTSRNEMFPFVSENKRLYFASDGHPGFGGLDLFVTSQQVGTPDEQGTHGQVWQKPENLGHPVNSSYDDFSLAARNDNSGFFSSNRPGGTGSDDIYYFREAQDDSWQLAVGSSQFAVDSLQLADTSYTLELNKPYILENIYYDFDKWDIREDAKAALDSLVRILQTCPVTIELGSHTDCRGTEEYNRVLSQKRAESAVAYIRSQGIEPGRISAHGYGESQLVNRCDCNEAPPCMEAAHQENRRTEFRIVEWKKEEIPPE